MKLRVPHPLSLSLLTIALVIIGVSLRFGVPAYQQWSAINEIQQYGFIFEVRRVGPDWLRAFVGENHMNAFDEIESIHFRHDIKRQLRIWFVWNGPTGPVIDDAVLANVRNLPNLKHLDLSCTNVTDAGMENVRCLRKLERLDVEGTDVSDASVSLLKRLKNLKRLSLRGTRVTNAGVSELKSALPGLEVTQ